MASVYRRTYRDKATGKLKRCRTYTIELSDGRRIKGYTDKLASERKASNLETMLARGEQGLIDPYADHKARPLSAHVADYLAELRTAGRDGMYVYTAEKRLNAVFNACGWGTLPDITLDAFCRWRESGPVCGGTARRSGRKASGKTLNQYLDTVRAFCNWCVKRGRMAENPLRLAEKVTEEPVRPRRPLTLDQARTLLEKAPADRRRVYLFALATGLRRQEIADLEWQDVRLDAPAPFLRLRAAKTKARRADCLYLKPELAAELRSMRPEGVPDARRVFPSVPDMKTYRSDLDAAGIPYRVEGRGQADFHALRSTLATLLASSGVSPRVAMEQMRLTDRRLLDHVYTDARALDLAEVAERLPDLMPDRLSTDAAKATGTDGGCQKKAPRLAGRLAGTLTSDRQASAGIGRGLPLPAGALSLGYPEDTRCPAGSGRDSQGGKRMRHLGLEPRTR